MTQELIVTDATPSMTLTPEAAANQREQFAAYVKTQLKQDVDFGVVPGTGDKPCLLQPGADKLLNLYGLTTRMTVVAQVEDWEKGFFMYRYRADVVWPRRMGDGSIREEVLAQCEGSCNSKESKYGYRWAKEEELSPELKAQAIAGTLKSQGRETMLFEWKMTPEQKEKAARENWKREQKTSKAGKTYYVVYDPHGLVYRVPNDGIYDQVNTIQKMAQKRARVGATIQAVKASDMFTQDMEDLADSYTPAPKAEEKVAQNGAETAKAGPPVVDAEILDEPKDPELKPQEVRMAERKDGAEFPSPDKDENGIKALMESATNEAAVLAAWEIAYAQQEKLGPEATKRLRDLKNSNLKRVQGGKK